MGVAVIGQVGRDLVMRAAGMPETGGSAPIVERRDLRGGKGANQAVGLTQLGVPAALVGVVGDDSDGDVVLEQAAADGIDTTGVARRGTTALLVDLVDEPSSRRLFEDIPSTARVSVDDLERARGVLDVADTVSIQLHQPPNVRDELLARVGVLRADAKEAELLAGEPVTTVPNANSSAKRLLMAGPQ